MADYTAVVEAGNALLELLRDSLTPEPLGNRELISLCSPHESENNQLTLYLYHMEEESQNMSSGYYQVDQNTQRTPSRAALLCGIWSPRIPKRRRSSSRRTSIA